MRGTLILDKDMSDKIDNLIAEYIQDHVMQKSVIIKSVTKINAVYGRESSKVYSVEFQDIVTELASDMKPKPLLQVMRFEDSNEQM